MQASAKSSAPALPPEGIVALVLALPARRQGEKSLPLLALLPFLALGWRAAAVGATARGWGAAGALPWLGIRWLPWTEAGGAPAPPAATRSGSGPEALGRPPDEASASGEARQRGEGAAVLAALTPMVQFAAARRGQPQGGASPEPQQALARTSPFLLNPSVRSAVTSLEGPMAAMVPEGGELPSQQAQANRPQMEAAGAQAQRRGNAPQAADEILSAGFALDQEAGAAAAPAAHPATSGSLVELIWQRLGQPSPAQELTVRTKIADAAVDLRSSNVPGASPVPIVRQRMEAGREPAAVPEPARRGSLVDLVWQVEKPAATMEVPARARVSSGAIDARSPDEPSASAAGGILRPQAEASREPATPPELPWRGLPVDLTVSGRETPSIQPGAPMVAGLALDQLAAGPWAGESDASTPFAAPSQAPAIASPLPWRRQQRLAELAGLVGPAELATAGETVEQLVERQVERVLDRRMEQVQAQAGGQPPAPSRSLAEELLDDNVARALMRKLQSLAEEERSRQGYLR